MRIRGTAGSADSSNGSGRMESSNTSRGGVPMRHRRQLLSLVVPLACLAAWGVSRVGLARVDDDPGRKEKAPAARAEPRPDPGAKAWTTAVAPKPLSRNVKKGLHWLAGPQTPRGRRGEVKESAAQAPRPPP